MLSISDLELKNKFDKYREFETDVGGLVQASMLPYNEKLVKSSLRDLVELEIERFEGILKKGKVIKIYERGKKKEIKKLDVKNLKMLSKNIKRKDSNKSRVFLRFLKEVELDFSEKGYYKNSETTQYRKGYFKKLLEARKLKIKKKRENCILKYTYFFFKKLIIDFLKNGKLIYRSVIKNYGKIFKAVPWKYYIVNRSLIFEVVKLLRKERKFGKNKNLFYMFNNLISENERSKGSIFELLKLGYKRLSGEKNLISADLSILKKEIKSKIENSLNTSKKYLGKRIKLENRYYDILDMVDRDVYNVDKCTLRAFLFLKRIVEEKKEEERKEKEMNKDYFNMETDQLSEEEVKSFEEQLPVNIEEKEQGRFFISKDEKMSLKERHFLKRSLLNYNLVRSYFVTMDYYQFRKIGERILKKEGNVEKNLCLNLEGRLCYFIYRCCFFSNIFEIISFFKDNCVYVNKEIKNNLNYKVQIFDILQMDVSIKLQMYLNIGRRIKNKSFLFPVPSYIKVSFKFLYAYMYRLPTLKDLVYPIKMDVVRAIMYVE